MSSSNFRETQHFLSHNKIHLNWLYFQLRRSSILNIYLYFFALKYDDDIYQSRRTEYKLDPLSHLSFHFPPGSFIRLCFLLCISFFGSWIHSLFPLVTLSLILTLWFLFWTCEVNKRMLRQEEKSLFLVCFTENHLFIAYTWFSPSTQDQPHQNTFFAHPSSVQYHALARHHLINSTSQRHLQHST